jgi:hypothetical protein
MDHQKLQARCTERRTCVIGLRNGGRAKTSTSSMLCRDRQRGGDAAIQGYGQTGAVRIGSGPKERRRARFKTMIARIEEKCIILNFERTFRASYNGVRLCK